MVTELVINALKHGFPGGAEGEILVSYEAKNSGWRLSISDNGPGTDETTDEPPHIGLGTSIVEALAQQLEATVQRTTGTQGTTVTIRSQHKLGRSVQFPPAIWETVLTSPQSSQRNVCNSISG